MAVIWRGIETIKFLEGVGAPFMLLVGLVLLFWITRKAGGFGPVLHMQSKFHSTSEFVRFFIPALTGMVGFWSTVALNIPDFTRYAKSQRAQMVGQALGLPTAMTLYSFIGVAVTSASAVIFGWMVGCSALLGPIAGIMIFDYYLVRRRQLVVEDLYRRGGAYEYLQGFNLRAIVALAVGVTVALLGLAAPAVRWLYDYAWFI